MSAIDDGAMQDKDDDLVKRHPGPFDGPDAELARACAMAVIPFYGDDDEVTHQRIMKDGVWNDHVAVQSALAAIHHLKTKAAALDAAAAVDGDHVDIRTVTAYESGFEAGKDEGAAERDRLQGRVATLQKALDDHWAADLKAAKAIFAETGRKWGFPDNTEVVAFYVAEVGRLESELKLAKSAAEDYDKDCIDMRYQRDAALSDRDSLQGRVATLEKAFTDRNAADRKAWKAIMEKAGRTQGIPPDKEVVAYYVAEVERLEKEGHEARMAEHQTFMAAAAINVENDSLRAKLDRAAEAFEPLVAACEEDFTSDQTETICRDSDYSSVAASSIGQSALTFGHIRKARAFLSELSADAPVQRTYDPRFDGDPSTWPLYNPARQQPITPPTREWCERMAKREGDQEIGAGKSLEQEKTDPRDPDPTRKGIFRDHNCWKCNSGANPCIVGNPSQCKYPHARND